MKRSKPALRKPARAALLAILIGTVLLLMLPGHSRAADSLPATVAGIKPSVVAVGFFKETQNPRFGFRGTGFIVGDGNLVVTNRHVVERPADDNDSAMLAVYIRDEGPERVRKAEIVETDRAHDLVLLRIEGKPLPALNLGAANAVREGQMVAFTGFPLGGVLGFAPVTHRGTIASITTVALPSPTARQLDERTVSRLREGSFEMYQLDATAYPGNSGGPLFDVETGAVVGVVNMVALKNTRESALTNPSGITYAIPVQYVRRFVEARTTK
jgi:serine protease Do